MRTAPIEQVLNQLLASPESELVEFKEAKQNFSLKDFGKYFSALSNEARLRGAMCGWLVFGVSNKREIVGTAFRKDGGLQNLKRELAGHTNDRLTFLDIFEITVKGKRVILFQIPPATPGYPTTWNDAPWAREDDSCVPLPLNKCDIIRSMKGRDWSREIVADASLADLSEEAIAYAKTLFAKRHQERKGGEDILGQCSDSALLDKMGLTIQGKITHTALVLLGKPSAKAFFDGITPRISWTLYSSKDNQPMAYEHFDMPLLLAIDKVFTKIRNEKYRYIAGQLTLFPEEVDQYDTDLIRELINNAIAHQDFQRSGRINIEEFEDHLVVINEGSFIPETIEQVLQQGYRPPYYRNQFLCDAMVNLYMIDTNAIGIPRMFKIQRDRCFPLPSYDLSDPTRVRVTIYGRVLDPNYTRLLHAEEALDIQTVFLLDKIQKGEHISKEDAARLKAAKLIEGRYPRLFVSYKIATLVGEQVEYVRNKGLENRTCQELIVNALKTCGELNKQKLIKIVSPALPAILDAEQKRRKMESLLKQLKGKGIIQKVGGTRNARWKLV